MKAGFGHTVICRKAVCQFFGVPCLEVEVHVLGKGAEARVSGRVWVGDTRGGLGIQEGNKHMKGSV